MKNISISLFMIVSILAPTIGWASDGQTLNLTNHWLGITALSIFAVSYLFVMAEEFTHLRKSKPVMLAAGIIWGMIGWYGSTRGMSHEIEAAIRHNLLEYSELMLFLLVAMTYINAMDERNVFASLRSWLVNKDFSLRQLFWITGILAFFISPVADNLTTALLLCAVVIAVGGSNVKFISLACINIVVAANAGGAFSPFGDITTLMVWQKGIVQFQDFFVLFVPSAVNYLVPAAIMHFAVPNAQPDDATETVQLKVGARRIIALFLLTIITAVSFHNFLHLPPVIGMLTGLSYLQFFGYYLKKRCERAHKAGASEEELGLICSEGGEEDGAKIGNVVAFDVFNKIARSEWDTLLFFYGVVLAVGGLGFLGYLTLTSELMYTQWGATPANITVGVLSAIVDNIPVMFAVLTMNPEMSQGQWLLVTLTAGVGGSMLSIGSAAGVALMGQARGMYTFFGHLKWTPVIALGYFASIATHLWINKALF
ncbi:MAG TPA: sodium:proton antiporter [Thiotrichales bacterium]|nr:sodium:proton antiporter [Thiotrichales bacterium]